MFRNLILTSFFLLLSLFSHSQHTVEVADKMKRSTFKIIDPYTSSLGSGFVCQGSKYIITNYHVVRYMEEINISFYQQDEDLYKCEIEAYDRNLDLAVLSLKEGYSLLSNNKISIAHDKINIGSEVLASGYPYNDYQFSNGIISGRKDYNNINYIQHTAPLSQGNSGGPLVNENGDVIGVNTYIRIGGENMGYAIPIDHVVQLLIKCGEQIKNSSFSDMSNPHVKYLQKDSDLDSFTTEEKVINHQKDDQSSSLSLLNYLYGFLLLCVFLILLYIIFVE